MTNDFQAHLDAIDKTVLSPLVSRALQCTEIDIIDWRYDLLNAAGGRFFGVIGMVRFSGHARDHSTGDRLPWSMILKALRAILTPKTATSPTTPTGNERCLPPSPIC